MRGRGRLKLRCKAQGSGVAGKRQAQVYVQGVVHGDGQAVLAFREAETVTNGTPPALAHALAACP